jgi:hypothetical protein
MRNPIRLFVSKIKKIKTLYVYFTLVKEQRGFVAAIKFLPVAYRRINRKNTYIR